LLHSSTAHSLPAIDQRDNRDRLGLAAAAGNLHCLLTGQRIAAYVLAGGPDSSPSQNSRLMFHKYGNEYFLAQVREIYF
jgi:hypothetical protein